MPATKSPADEMLKRVIDEAFVAVLKPRGFKKTAHNFHRRLGEVVQVVNVQLSQGSSYSEKLFYVNVGLAFDEICSLIGQSTNETPKEHECATRGRLEEFLRNAHERWEVGGPNKLDSMISKLRGVIEELAEELNQVTSPSDYLAHDWFRRESVSLSECAQIHYVVGDLDSAWADVQRMCVEFADRELLGKPEYWIDELKLTKLHRRLKQKSSK